ncbi:Uncharacterised protein [Candidatus Tiddalikarchaeum anstoanum]|nr:Uncharacterised protein [Candidatus Tiddalikarchaeum anstoanum]
MKTPTVPVIYVITKNQFSDGLIKAIREQYKGKIGFHKSYEKSNLEIIDENGNVQIIR